MEQRIDLETFQKLIDAISKLPCRKITSEKARQLRIKKVKKEIEDKKFKVSCLCSDIEFLEKELEMLNLEKAQQKLKELKETKENRNGTIYS